jgi:hypothetical protein
VAESAADPPGPIPNPVVTRRSAGEYSGGDPMGGEAAAGAPRPGPDRPERGCAPAQNDSPRGGAAAARWAHNPKVGGSNPPPATTHAIAPVMTTGALCSSLCFVPFPDHLVGDFVFNDVQVLNSLNEETEMVIVGLEHVQVAMPAGQEAFARAFYGDLLGLAERQKPENLAKRGGC